MKNKAISILTAAVLLIALLASTACAENFVYVTRDDMGSFWVDTDSITIDNICNCVKGTVREALNGGGVLQMYMVYGWKDHTMHHEHWFQIDTNAKKTEGMWNGIIGQIQPGSVHDQIMQRMMQKAGIRQ